MNISIATLLFIDIIFHARIFYSVNRLFLYIISQLSLFFKKKRARFSNPSSSPSFSSPSPRPQPSPTIRYQCLVLPRANPQTMLKGKAQRLTLPPTPVSAPFSIPVCFRAQSHPPYRPPLSLCHSPRIRIYSCCYRNSCKAWQRSPQGLEEQEVRHFCHRGDRRGGTQEEARPAPQGTHHSYLAYPSRPVFSSFIILLFTFPHTHRERLRMRASIPHPSVNAVALPRIPSRRLTKTPIMLNPLLNQAPRPRRLRRRRRG